MHPAVADCSLHLSAIPDASTARVPVSLSALAAPERRNGTLQHLWASTHSASQGGAIIGDMAVSAAGAPSCLSFTGLVSKSMPTPKQARPP